jgi:opacity protein-like surface antigen
VKIKFPLLLVSFFFAKAAYAQALDTKDVAWAQARKRCAESSDRDNCCVDMTNVYAKIFGGANFLQNTTITENKSTYQTGYIFSGSLGYCWRYGLHIEAEYAFRKNGINKIDFFSEGSSKNGHFQASSYMGNLLWYVPLCSWGCSFWNIRPLFGAGVGYDSQRMHASNSRIIFDQKWHPFSWQLMTGLAFPIFCSTEFTLEYKFHQGGSHFNNHAIGIGLAYKFRLE